MSLPHRWNPRETSRERADLLAPTLADRHDAALRDQIAFPPMRITDDALRAIARAHPEAFAEARAAVDATALEHFATYRLAVHTKHAIQAERARYDWTERYTYDMRGAHRTTTLWSVWAHARDLLAEDGVGAVRVVLVKDRLRLETTAVAFEDVLTTGEYECESASADVAHRCAECEGDA